MGHPNEADSIQYDNDGYGDVTGSDYGLTRDPFAAPDLERVAGVVLEASLRADAAEEAARTVLVQGIRAMSAAGKSVREIAAALDVSKSLVSRELRRTPKRWIPLPEIDQLVKSVWDDGLQTTWSRPVPRPGDSYRELDIRLNILSSLANDTTPPSTESDR